MRTTHRLVHGDARDLASVEDDSIDLVVTSPPYPMVSMWDETFAEMDPAVAEALDGGAGAAAFDRMHAQLDDAWAQLARVVVDGGIVCVNIGDATRSLDGSFRVYANHARVVDRLEGHGFSPLPGLIWRKPTNAATKFMGSGMLPPNAYPTLEHEHILICRMGSTQRSFPPGDDDRYASAYFWEERNDWFSDVWTDVTGVDQTLGADAPRERSGAFPVTIPYRLISMFSVYGDTVLDPFAGTGTTTLAAMLAARSSVSVETEPRLLDTFPSRLESIEERSAALVRSRLSSHRRFVETHRAAGGDFGYTASRYDVPVKTRQERLIALRAVDEVEADGETYEVTHRVAGRD